jgi:hypothetical protein
MEGYTMKRSIISLLTIMTLSLASVQPMQNRLTDSVLTVEDALSGAKIEDVIRVADALKLIIDPEYHDQTSWNKLSFTFKRYAQFIANFLKKTPNVRTCTLALAQEITQDRKTSFGFITDNLIVELLEQAEKFGSPILFNALVCATMNDTQPFSRSIKNKLLKDHFESAVKRQRIYKDIDQTRRVGLKISLPECVEDGYLLPENPLDNFFSFCDYIQEVGPQFVEEPNNLLNIQNYSIVTNKDYHLDDTIHRALEKATQEMLASTKAKIANHTFDKNKDSFDSWLAKFQDPTCKKICLRAMAEWLRDPKNLDFSDRYSALTFFNAQPEGFVKMTLRFINAGRAFDNLDITAVRTALERNNRGVCLDSCFTGDNDPALSHMGMILELAQALYRNDLGEVELRNNNLTRIPEWLFSLSGLRELHLDNNQISEVSAKICNAKKLTMLSLDNNQLQSIPEEIGLLPELNGLALISNALTTLPATLNHNQPRFIYLQNNPDFCVDNLPIELKNNTSINIFT